MAEGAVSFVLENMKDLLVEEGKLLIGVSDEVGMLRNKLEMIRSFLKDADIQRTESERVKVWVSQIRDVAYDIEDLIDSFIIEVRQHKQNNIALTLVYYLNRLWLLHKFAKRVEQIKIRLDQIKADREQLGLVDLQAGESSNKAALAWRQVGATSVEEDDVVGFIDETEVIAKLLIDGENKRRQVVSIVGMGGSGKTTLAKKLYNRSDIKSHFDCCAFLCVSQVYGVKTLLESALKQVDVLGNLGNLDTMGEVEIINEAYDYLKERRYLVVLDDIWKGRDWDKLSSYLPNVEGKGSRVLLTTRNADVALRADSFIKPYELRPLNDKESWELFNKKVCCPTDLEKLGKEIVAKCCGLPLAILVMGGLLSTKNQTHAEWSKVLASAKWQLISQGTEEISRGVLALSYIDLPFYLKSCFLYLGIFPEDYKINAERVIRLWIAEGFIHKRGEETLEDVAEDYLQKLIHRSMVQVAERRSDGQIFSCRLHDLLREFAISEAEQDNFFGIGSESGSVPSSFRRLVIDHHPDTTTRGMYDTSNSNWNRRSLFYFGSFIDVPVVSLKFIYGASIKMIRVLDLSKISIKDSAFNELNKLTLLKYLAFPGDTVPSSIVKLCNLQTLLLTGYSTISISDSIWKLRQLRHLEVMGDATYISNTIWSCSHRPAPRIDYTRDLQTIRLPAGNWIEGGIDKLTNLRSLSIDGRFEMRYIKALWNSLPKLCKLGVLELYGDEDAQFFGKCFDFNEIPSFPSLSVFSHHVHLYKLALQGNLEKHPQLSDFPPNLTELELSCSRLNDQQQDDCEPSIIATLEKLPKLKVLSLRDNAYMGKEMACSTGGFPHLKVLRLASLSKLEEWTIEEGALPNLWDLTISDCSKLKMLPDELRNLQKISLVEISPELEDRVKENVGEDWHKIKDIPSITIRVRPWDLF